MYNGVCTLKVYASIGKPNSNTHRANMTSIRRSHRVTQYLLFTLHYTMETTNTEREREFLGLKIFYMKYFSISLFHEKHTKIYE